MAPEWLDKELERRRREEERKEVEAKRKIAEGELIDQHAPILMKQLLAEVIEIVAKYRKAGGKVAFQNEGDTGFSVHHEENRYPVVYIQCQLQQRSMTVREVVTKENGQRHTQNSVHGFVVTPNDAVMFQSMPSAKQGVSIAAKAESLMRPVLFGEA